VHKFILLIRCVQIYICILLTFVNLLCHFLFVFVWRHCNERRKLLASKFSNFAGFRPPLNRSFNMKSCRAIWRFITKNESYGFIILYKTINVMIFLFHWMNYGFVLFRWEISIFHGYVGNISWNIVILILAVKGSAIYSKINIREYRRGNHKLAIQRNWRLKVLKTNTFFEKNKEKYNTIYVGRHYSQTKHK
jgi:hypothetical protein